MSDLVTGRSVGYVTGHRPGHLETRFAVGYRADRIERAFSRAHGKQVDLVRYADVQQSSHSRVMWPGSRLLVQGKRRVN